MSKSNYNISHDNNILNKFQEGEINLNYFLSERPKFTNWKRDIRAKVNVWNSKLKPLVCLRGRMETL